MRLTILLITEPAEEARLAKGLRGAFLLRLRGDLDEAAPPHEQILREQPDALILGGGLDEAAAYIEAAREYLPGCSICLLAERAQAEAARRLRPNALFLRPVKLTELLTTLESLGSGRVAPAAPRTAPRSGAPEPPRRAAPEPPKRPSSAGLLRLDDMMLDPMGFLGGGSAAPRAAGPRVAEPRTAEPPAAEPPAAEPPPEAEPRGRRASLSGQFQQLVVVPEELLEEARPQAREGKVAVDPTLYEDALSDIDVDALGDEGSGPGPGAVGSAAQPGRAPTAPPPLPADLGAARRRSEPAGAPPSPVHGGAAAPTAPPPPPAHATSAAPSPPPPAHGASAAPGAPPPPPAHVTSGPPPVPRDATLPRRTTQPPVLPPPPPAPPLEATAPPPPPAEGDLQATDPPTLIGWLCTSGYSGCLQLNRDGETAQRLLYFDGGELVAAASALPVDSLPEAALYHEGRLSREQLKRARQLLDSAGGEVTNRRLAQLLADEQLLPKGEIAPLLRRHVIEIFYRSFAWEKGRYRLLSKTAPPEDRVRLKETPKLLLLEGLRRKASLDSLLARVGPDSTLLRPVASGGLLLKDAGVTAFEQRALPLFDGRHTLAQISRQSGLAEHATYVLAYALICLGGLRRPEADAPRPRPAPSDPGARPRPPAPESPPPVDDRADRAARARDRVRRKQAHVTAADYFTLLDLTEMAGADEVRRAHDALRAKLSSERLPPEVGAELGAELGEIREVLGEAYAVLSSDELRAAYRAQLLPLPDEPPPAKG